MFHKPYLIAAAVLAAFAVGFLFLALRGCS
jgi:hypothetical protein